MDMYSCPKWDGCSVPICPPDPDWKSRKILGGERVRFYLTEHSKLPARPILRARLPSELYEILFRVYPKVIARYGPIHFNAVQQAIREAV
jgi:hypothetical protein